MKKNSKIIIAVAALVALIAIFVGVFLATRPDTAAGAKTITVEVVHKDESTKTFTYNTDAEYLGEVLLAEGLVEGQEGPYGLEVLVVDGEQAIWAEDGAYWALYVGEEYGTTGVDTTPISDGDAFKLVYTLG